MGGENWQLVTNEPVEQSTQRSGKKINIQENFQEIPTIMSTCKDQTMVPHTSSNSRLNSYQDDNDDNNIKEK